MTQSGFRVEEVCYGPSLSVTPSVSVLMITYNHERYVREAIESVFAQETEFPVELIIGEDCSTDRTREVIDATCRDAPIPVRVITSDVNVGMHANFERVVAKARGTYAALIEGDDAWLYPFKLKSQHSVLENKPDVSMAFHRASIRFESGASRSLLTSDVDTLPDTPAGLYSFDEILGKDYLIPTASVVLRLSTLRRALDRKLRLPFIDEIIFLEAALDGTVAADVGVWCEYRIHDGGASRGFDYETLMLARIKMLSIYSESVPLRKRQSVLREFESRTHSLANWFESIGANKRALALLWYSLRVGSFFRSTHLRTFKWIARLTFPRTHKLLSCSKDIISKALSPKVRS